MRHNKGSNSKEAFSKEKRIYLKQQDEYVEIVE